MGFSENTTGLVLAMVSSLFIGTSFILKKKGLKRAAAAGTRAGLNWDNLFACLISHLFCVYVTAPALKLQCLYGCTIPAIKYVIELRNYSL